MIYKLIDKIKYKLFLRWIKPEIIGYKNQLKNIISKTRVSNMTHISNPINVDIEENVFIGHFNYIDGYNKIKIATGCQITNYVTILTHSTHHSLRFQTNSSNHPYPKETVLDGEVSIGAYSYIGAHSVIMPGSKLGKGCIVSAFSYVNGEYPDFSILRGQPATVIGSTKESDEKLIEKYPELLDHYYLNGNTR